MRRRCRAMDARIRPGIAEDEKQLFLQISRPLRHALYSSPFSFMYATWLS